MYRQEFIYIQYKLGLDKLCGVENPLVGHLICEMHLVVDPSQDTVAAAFAAPSTCSKVVNYCTWWQNHPVGEWRSLD